MIGLAAPPIAQVRLTRRSSKQRIGFCLLDGDACYVEVCDYH
jgi:hypothetical protein